MNIIHKTLQITDTDTEQEQGQITITVTAADIEYRNRLIDLLNRKF
jgi:hypothetical protein